MEIVEYSPVEHCELWRDFVSNHPVASPYHSREWATVVCRSFGFKERSLIGLQDGRICALLPLWQTNRGTLVSSPWRDRGDALCRGANDRREFLFALKKRKRSVIIKGWMDPQCVDGFFLEKYWVTHILDLTAGRDSIWKHVNKVLGRNIRKARNEGLVVSEDGSIEDLQHFYSLFVRTRKRLGVPTYPYSLFENILSCTSRDVFHLHVAFFGNVPVSAALILDGGDCAVYAYGAYDIRYQEMRANDLVIWQAIESSMRRGNKFFDFGADSPCQKGLHRFKRKWGAKAVTLPVLRSERIDPEREDFSSDRYRLHRRLLSYVPSSFLVFLGGYLMKRGG